MLVVGEAIVPEELFTDCFMCDMASCRGACCIEGDAGAPLDEEEIAVLEDIIDVVKPYMTPQGRAVVEQNGVFDYDEAGGFVTPLIDQKDCAFLIKEAGIARCAIEKAWEEGALQHVSFDPDFNKPISCYLYPIRLFLRPNGLTSLHYHRWEICEDARKLGKAKKVSIFEFLKKPLIRKFGEQWYEEVLRIRKLKE
ncbi:MAG: DUF3109 family protein [Bacteroidales bacterium]|nr:DUF3109 family protein [Bacteroidales bacterium]